MGLSDLVGPVLRSFCFGLVNEPTEAASFARPIVDGAIFYVGNSAKHSSASDEHPGRHVSGFTFQAAWQKQSHARFAGHTTPNVAILHQAIDHFVQCESFVSVLNGTPLLEFGNHGLVGNALRL